MHTKRYMHQAMNKNTIGLFVLHLSKTVLQSISHIANKQKWWYQKNTMIVIKINERKVFQQLENN